MENVSPVLFLLTQVMANKVEGKLTAQSSPEKIITIEAGYLQSVYANI